MPKKIPEINDLQQHPVYHAITQQLSYFSVDTHFLVACSGGHDSLILLAILHKIIPNRLRVIHINHQLQTDAAVWAQYVKNWTAKATICCEVVAVNVKKGNVEAMARQARYEAFAQYIQQNEVLVLGHNLTDQAETVLLRLLSGSGVQGLSGMKIHSLQNTLNIWRPLLEFSRADYESLGEILDVVPINDPMNTDLSYDRVWLREQILPQLMQRKPHALKALSCTASLMQDAQHNLNAFVALTNANLNQTHTNKINTDQLNTDQINTTNVLKIDTQSKKTYLNQPLLIANVQSCSQELQNLLLRQWLQSEYSYPPPRNIIEQIKQQHINGRHDNQATVLWNDLIIRKYDGYLIAINAAHFKQLQHTPLTRQEFTLNTNTNVTTGCLNLKIKIYNVPTISNTTLKTVLKNKLAHLTYKPFVLIIEPIHSVKSVLLRASSGHQNIKKLLQEWKIAPWLRLQCGLLFKKNISQNELLGVVTPQGFYPAYTYYTTNIKPHKFCNKMSCLSQQLHIMSNLNLN